MTTKTDAASHATPTYTKGPWRVEKDTDIDGNDTGYARVFSEDFTHELSDYVNIEDAHLIAAAPDYWDAAEQMDKCSELEGDEAGYVAVPKDAYDALMAAHAKAEGRS